MRTQGDLGGELIHGGKSLMQDVYVIWDDSFAKRVIENLEKDPHKLDGMVGTYEVPSDVRTSSPSFIDEVEEHIPEDLPSCDLILAIGVGSYLLSVPSIAEKTGAKGVIVPIEKSDWYQLGLLNQTKVELENMGVEHAFPRPFCALEARGRKSIERFVKDFEIGRPSLKADVEGGRIVDVQVEVSAPCGSTHTVAEKIGGTPVSFESSDILELEGLVSEAHHSHPCTGDMMEDPILGETILHRAGYLVRNAVKEAVGLDLDVEKEAKAGAISEECSILCEECVESCDRSSTGILEMEDDEIVIPNYERCNGCRHCVKACPIDVTGKIVTKRDNILLEKWKDAKLSN